MTDPVVVTPASETIDPAVAVVSRGKAAFSPAASTAPAAVFIAITSLRGEL